MANIVYRQMSAVRELPQKIPAPQAKAWMQKPQSGGKVLVQVPWGAWEGGGVVMDEIDTCITNNYIDLYSLMHHFFKDNLNSEAF